MYIILDCSYFSTLFSLNIFHCSFLTSLFLSTGTLRSASTLILQLFYVC